MTTEQYPYQRIISKHISQCIGTMASAEAIDMVALRRSLADCIDDLKRSGYEEVECEIQHTDLNRTLVLREQAIASQVVAPEWPKIDPEVWKPLVFLVFHLYEHTYYAVPVGWATPEVQVE